MRLISVHKLPTINVQPERIAGIVQPNQKSHRILQLMVEEHFSRKIQGTVVGRRPRAWSPGSHLELIACLLCCSSGSINAQSLHPPHSAGHRGFHYKINRNAQKQPEEAGRVRTGGGWGRGAGKSQACVVHCRGRAARPGAAEMRGCVEGANLFGSNCRSPRMMEALFVPRKT